MAEGSTPLINESTTTSQSNMSVTSENESAVSEAMEKFVRNVVEEMERKMEKYEKVGKPGGQAILSRGWDLSKYAAQIIFGAAAATMALAEGWDYSKAGNQAAKFGELIGETYIKDAKRIGQRGKTKLVRFALGEYRLDTIKLRRLICEAAGRIFQAFEYQIMEINKQDSRVYQKLADIVVKRFIWSLTKCEESIKNDEDLVRILSQGAVDESSKAEGMKINSNHKRAWHTGSMLSKSGVKDRGEYYTKDDCKTDKYGYRLPLKNEDFRKFYIYDKKPIPFEYTYVLTVDLVEELVSKIYDKINEEDPIVALQMNKELVAEIVSDATKMREDLEATGTLVKKCSSDMDYTNNQLDIAIKIAESNLEKTEPIKSNLKKLGQHQDNSLSYIAAIQQSQQTAISTLTKLSETTGQTHENVKIIEKALISRTLFSIGHPIENFRGRTVDLEKLRRHFDTVGRRVIIIGEESIGKAELARKYAADNFNNEMFNGLWFDAHDIISLKDSLYLRAKEMEVSLYRLNERKREKRSIQEIAEDIYRKTENRQTLLVFNAVNSYTVLRKILPWRLVPAMENIYTIIITRELSLINHLQMQDSLVELETFKEGADYVKSSLGTRATLLEAKQLCPLLKNSPLALSLAIGYLKSRDFKIRNYAQQIKERKATATWSLGDLIREMVKISLDGIEKNKDIGCKALDLLKIIACLSPDFILSDKFFNSFVDNPDQLREALDLLKKFAIIRLDGGIVRVHRLVYRELQEWLSEKQETESYLKTVLDITFLWTYENLSEHLVPASNIVKFLELACNFREITLSLFKRDEKVSRLVLEYLTECDMDIVVGKIFEHLKDEPDMYYRNYREHTLRMALKLESVNVLRSLQPDHLKWIYFLKVLNALKLGETDILRSFLENMKEDRYDFINRPMEDLRQCALIEEVNFYTDDVKDEVCGKPPLILAICERNKMLLEILVEAGAYTTVTYERMGEKRKSALYVAVEKNLPEMVLYLLEKGCILENDETFPFHLAAEKGLNRIVDIFLDQPRNCNLINNIGQTPLHLAAMSGHLQIVKSLTNHGADVNVYDHEGHLAIYYAMINEKTDVEDYLRKLNNPEDLFV